MRIGIAETRRNSVPAFVFLATIAVAAGAGSVEGGRRLVAELRDFQRSTAERVVSEQFRGRRSDGKTAPTRARTHPLTRLPERRHDRFTRIAHNGSSRQFGERRVRSTPLRYTQGEIFHSESA